jgi:hypothetical protein
MMRSIAGLAADCNGYFNIDNDETIVSSGVGDDGAAIPAPAPENAKTGR